MKSIFNRRRGAGLLIKNVLVFNYINIRSLSFSFFGIKRLFIYFYLGYIGGVGVTPDYTFFEHYIFVVPRFSKIN